MSVARVADFGALIERPREIGTWVPASFPMPDGTLAVLQEPDAILVVQNGALRVAAVPFSRSHDRVQVLDNAKHMYFSTQSFEAPAGGRLTVEWDMSAAISGGEPGDLYDGFVSFHLLNLAGGVAVDIFVGNTELATVYARLPFPGAEPPDSDEAPRYFSLFRGRWEPGARYRSSSKNPNDQSRHAGTSGEGSLADRRRDARADRERAWGPPGPRL